MDKFLSILKSFIEALNGVGMQVWAIVILVIGASLVAIHQAEHGSMIIGGSLALLSTRHRTRSNACDRKSLAAHERKRFVWTVLTVDF
jgi:hypothetical protein